MCALFSVDGIASTKITLAVEVSRRLGPSGTDPCARVVGEQPAAEVGNERFEALRQSDEADEAHRLDLQREGVDVTVPDVFSIANAERFVAR